MWLSPSISHIIVLLKFSRELETISSLILIYEEKLEINLHVVDSFSINWHVSSKMVSINQEREQEQRTDL